MHRLTIAAVVISLAPASVLAQQNGRRTPARDDAAAPDSGRFTSSARELRGLRWRLVGPFRGGRAVAVTGDPTKRNVFYFGAVDGGVWKTTNGGTSWRNISDGVSKIASVGAI